MPWAGSGQMMHMMAKKGLLPTFRSVGFDSRQSRVTGSETVNDALTRLQLKFWKVSVYLCANNKTELF